MIKETERKDHFYSEIVANARPGDIVEFALEPHQSLQMITRTVRVAARKKKFVPVIIDRQAGFIRYRFDALPDNLGSEQENTSTS